MSETFDSVVSDLSSLHVEPAIGCSLCEEFNAEEIEAARVREFFSHFGLNSRVILSTREFAVIPSIGALTEGHVLVSPKDHYVAVGEMPPPILSAFEDFAADVRRLLANRYGVCSGFEHGCIERVSRAGACIDHAHLHYLPVKVDLTTAIAAKLGAPTPIRSLSDLRPHFEASKPYVYYEAPNGTKWAFDGQLVPSQLMRQFMWDALGRHGHWDWRTDIRVDVARATYDGLRKPLSEMIKDGPGL